MKGLRVIADHRAAVTREVREAAAPALTDGAGELLRVANQSVPVEEHILEESGTVIPATPENLTATVGYGGEAGKYAARQHEEETWKHDPGRRSKWLEMAAKEDGPRIMDWVGKQMKAQL